MADSSTNTVVHIGENSPEKVAYDLMRDVLAVEGFTLSPHVKDKKLADRRTILRAYAETYQVVKGYGIE